MRDDGKDSTRLLIVMPRQVGIAAIRNKEKAQDKFRSKKTAIDENELLSLTKQLDTFKCHLELFVKNHGSKIKQDPVFRAQFQEMCAAIGVDPIASSKGIWAELLGFGDFYYHTAIKIIEVCLATQPRNGGLIPLDEVCSILNKRTSDKSNVTSKSDVLQALGKLQVLGQGFRLIKVKVGGMETNLIQSVPGELNNFHTEVLGLATEGSTPGAVTLSQCITKLGWNEERAQKTIDQLIQEGLAWVDQQHRGEHLYWFPVSSLKQTAFYSSIVPLKKDLIKFPRSEVQSLQNGCKVALHMNIGTCYENDSNNGILKVLQLMAFKGTDKRSWKDIEKQAAERGAYLSGYTEREVNALFIRVLNKDVPWAVELLSEIAQTRSYDPVALNHVKKSVEMEMNEKENDLKYMVYDYLHATAYQGTPLQRPILGQSEVLNSLTPEDLSSFVSGSYKIPIMALSIAGGTTSDDAFSLANTFFSGSDTSYIDHKIPQRHKIRFTASDLRHRDDAYPLAHIAIAQEGPGHADIDNIALKIGLAGDGRLDLRRNAGLFLPNKWIVEEGYQNEHVHAAEFFHIPYHDTSLFGCYFVCTGRDLLHQGNYFVPNQILKNAIDLTKFKVERCKDTLKTNLCSQLSNTLSVSDDIGRQLLTVGRRIPTEEMLLRIEKIGVNQVKDTFYRYVYDQPIAAAAFGPIEALLDISNLEAKYRKILY